MRLFKKNRAPELHVLFPDGRVRVDRHPRTDCGALVSDKLGVVFRLTTPMPVCSRPHGKEPGAQPVPTGKFIWFKTGDESELLSDEELDDVLKLVSLRAGNKSLAKRIFREDLRWWVAFLASVGVALSVWAVAAHKWAAFAQNLIGWWR